MFICTWTVRKESNKGLVQFSHSVVSNFATPWIAACQASLSATNSWNLLKLVHQVADAIQRSHPLSSPSPPAFSISQNQGLFQWVSQLFASGSQSIGVSASASVLPMSTQDWSPSEWTGWISLQWGTLKSILQYHISKAAILQCSAFFIVQLSHPYMTAGKTIALTRWTFVGKVMSLLFFFQKAETIQAPPI